MQFELGFTYSATPQQWPDADRYQADRTREERGAQHMSEFVTRDASHQPQGR